jgi:uncharacterized membrane protein
MYRIPGPIRAALAVALLVVIGVVVRGWLAAHAIKGSALGSSGTDVVVAVAVIGAVVVVVLLAGIRRGDQP